MPGRAAGQSPSPLGRLRSRLGGLLGGKPDAAATLKESYPSLVELAQRGDFQPLASAFSDLVACTAEDAEALRTYEQFVLKLMLDVIGDGSGLIDKPLYKVLQKQLDWYYDNVYLRLPDDADVASFLAEFHRLERTSASYRRKTRAVFLKRRIPRAYAQNADAPIENKAVYLQPRSGMNQTFKYMHGYLENRGGYQQELWELRRTEVPIAFYYRNAEAMARSASTAKVIFLHESSSLLGLVELRPDAKVVQLWHGCGVFKKIGLDTADLPGYKSRASYEKYPEYKYCSCVTIASPELSWVFEQFMGIPKEAGIIRPLGVSRTDCFFDDDYRAECYRKLYENIPQAEGKKVVLYAPTYRGVGVERVAPDALDIAAMQRALSDEYVLIIKHHQTVKELPAIPQEAQGSFAFDMTRGCNMDIGELMTVADVCVSDYSSLVFEFSLFERPMAFFVYDLEEYVDNRGLYYDFEEITPGPLCRTTQDLIGFLREADEGYDTSEVVAFKNKFMSSCDGHATERIVAYIEGDGDA